MMAARMPTIAITTSSSMSEKALSKYRRLLALFDVEMTVLIPIMHPCLARLSPSSKQPAVLHGSLYLFEEWRQLDFGLRRTGTVKSIQPDGQHFLLQFSTQLGRRIGARADPLG